MCNMWLNTRLSLLFKSSHVAQYVKQAISPPPDVHDSEYSAQYNVSEVFWKIKDILTLIVHHFVQSKQCQWRIQNTNTRLNNVSSIL